MQHVQPQQQLTIALTHLKLINDQTQLLPLHVDPERRPASNPEGPPPPYGMHYFDLTVVSEEKRALSYAFHSPSTPHADPNGPSNLIVNQDLVFIRDLAETLGFKEGPSTFFSSRRSVRSRQLTRFVTDLYLASGFAIIVDGGDMVALSAKAHYSFLVYVTPDSGKASYKQIHDGPHEMKSALENLLPDLRGRGVYLHFSQILSAKVPHLRYDDVIDNYKLIWYAIVSLTAAMFS